MKKEMQFEIYLLGMEAGRVREEGDDASFKARSSSGGWRDRAQLLERYIPLGIAVRSRVEELLSSSSSSVVA